MNQQHLKAIINKLRPRLKDVAKAERILKQYWSNKMALVWEAPDVHKAANERGVALTNKEARTVLQSLLTQHNKQYGIRWEDLTTHIELHCLGRKLTQAETSRFVAKNIITIQK